MKKIFTYKQFCLLAMLAIFTSSCKREELSEVVKSQEGAKVSLTLPSKIEVAGGTNYTLDNSELIVPVTIDFDASATRAFAVQLIANLDTVNTLIANGALPAGTVAMQDGMFSIPPALNVAYGVNSVSFNIAINRTFLEKNYGKNIGFAIKMSGIAKGNVGVTGKTSTVLLIKTGQTIDPNAVHYVMFGNTATGILNFPTSPTQTGWTQGSQDLIIPLNLILTGQAGAGFTVDLTKSTAIVQQAIANGTLTNTRALSVDAYTFDAAKPAFVAGKNTVQTNINVKTSEIMFSPAGTKLAVGITLNNPTKWQLGGTNTSLILVFDPAHFKRSPFNGNPFIIDRALPGVESLFIPASNYDFGGEGIAYHDNGGRDGGPFRRPDEVDISDNNVTVGWTGDGEWLSYTVDVKQAGQYSFNAIIGAPGTDGRYSVFFGTTNVTVDARASRQTAGSYGDQRANFSLITLKQGVQVMRFFMDRGAYDVKGYQITPLNAYDGNYALTGTITRNSANGPDTNLGGEIKATDGRVRALVTTNKDNQVQLIPIWKDGTNVGAIDLTYLTVDPATNLVTVFSETNGAVKNTPGKENKYDPATKTFTLNFDWGSGADTRLASYVLKYTSARQ